MQRDKLGRIKNGWDVIFFDETEVNESNVLNKLGDLICARTQ